MVIEKLRDVLKIASAHEYALIEEMLVGVDKKKVGLSRSGIVCKVDTGGRVAGRIREKRRSNPPFC